MDCPPTSAARKQEPRPICPTCHLGGWWIGGRRIKWQAKLAPSGAPIVVEGLWRRRARCPHAECPMDTWTLYEEQGYPHRSYPPSVAIAAVGMLLACQAPWRALEGVSQHWGCCPRTLLRWVGWIGGLVEMAVLTRVCWAWDPSGIPPPTYKPRQGTKSAGTPGRAVRPSLIVQVGTLVLLFEHLARLMRDRGVPLEFGPGLGAFLRLQLDRFRLVAWLTKPYPGLRLDPFWPGG